MTPYRGVSQTGWPGRLGTRIGHATGLMARLVRPSTLSGVSPRKVTRRTILG